MVGPLIKVSYPEQLKRLIAEKVKEHAKRSGKKLRGAALEEKIRWNFAKSWKGKGYYYHRGKGRFSKYSPSRDKKYHSKVPNPHKKHSWHKEGSMGTGPYKHTRDSKTERKRRR